MKFFSCKILPTVVILAVFTVSLTACSSGSGTTSDSATGTVTTLSGAAQYHARGLPSANFDGSPLRHFLFKAHKY